MNKISIVLLLTFTSLMATDVKKEFYNNGVIKYEVIFNASKDSGCKIKTYYMNGGIKQEFSFDNNKECGLIK